MSVRLLAAAVMTVGLCAQTPVLIYDNGPFETSPGFSNMATATGHTVPGYGGQMTASADNALFDEFIISTPMVIEEVEFYCYQTGSGSTGSTIQGAFVAFYDTDPSLTPMLGPPMAGSTSPTFDLFSTPNNPVFNGWTGVYREINGDQAINRPIMAVRVRLEDAAGMPAPLTLGVGTYWLRVQAAGSAAPGPWFPPITCAGQLQTGNAMQHLAAGNVWVNPIQSGSAGPQGLPFRLFGPARTLGEIVLAAPGCGTTGISVCGSPNLGGFVRTVMTPISSSTIPIIGYGIAGAGQTFCGCNFVHDFPAPIWFATESVLTIPLSPGLAGLRIGIQGLEFGAIGGCSQFGGFTLTDGYEVQFNM